MTVPVPGPDKWIKRSPPRHCPTCGTELGYGDWVSNRGCPYCDNTLLTPWETP